MTQQLRASASDPFDVVLEKRPRHIAVIMDGNGRWARRRGLPRIEGHRHGANSVRRVTEECVRLGIEQLTLYCLSSENWKRPEEELQALMGLLRKYMLEERENLNEHNIRVDIIGRRAGIPSDISVEMDKTIEMTRSNTGLRLCLAVNYGARAEIVDAVKLIVQDVKDGKIEPEDLDEGVIGSNLYTSGMRDPDLLIRTANEMRLSNFLLWQISYAEVWITDREWPDFDEQLLRQAISDYAKRRRRFGGLPNFDE